MNKWPHAPLHIFNEEGTFIVTAATLHKEHYFKEKDHLDYLQNLFLELAEQYQWKLEAWSLFSNHYHFIAQSPSDPSTLREFISHFHGAASRYINKLQGTPGRKVWYQYWDTKITYQGSYLARLNYVMHNPVKHKIVECSRQYPWCSANWFKESTSKSYYETVMGTKTDKVTIFDDF